MSLSFICPSCLQAVEDRWITHAQNGGRVRCPICRSTCLVSLVSDTQKYKFRAECQNDIDALIALIPPSEIVSFEIKPAFDASFPDRVCEILFRGMKIERLKKLMRKIADGHVMVETVELSHKYTGKR